MKKKRKGYDPHANDIVDICPRGHKVTHENKVLMPDKSRPKLARCLMCGTEWERDEPIPEDRFSQYKDDYGN